MNLWKRKLAAYLHDPPSKCLDIRTHGERSEAAFRQAGLVDEAELGEYCRHADHTGAAADRLPFPTSRSAGLTCAFDGVRNAFRHPLGGASLPFHAPFRSVEEGFESEIPVQPVLQEESLAQLHDDDERWRARFFAHWRLWPRFAAESDYRLAFLPADTRLPDHTIWSHMQVVSALAGCAEPDGSWNPAFLRFQLGPVQEFIAEARSTRDLWSGSYLLSWLMAAGLKALSAEVGPDAVIYPSLRDQPLFDLHWKTELWERVRIGERGHSVWQTLEEFAERDSAPGPGVEPSKASPFLTPSLPNVFLAVVPANRAADLGRRVAEAIRAEWQKIRDSVWDKLRTGGMLQHLPPSLPETQAHDRFVAHTDAFLRLDWHALPWPADLNTARAWAADLPQPTSTGNEGNLLERFDTVRQAFTEAMPREHRDARFYVGGTEGPRTELNNIGLGWALLVALSGRSLDAVRQTRAFNAWNTGGWQSVGVAQNKDALTGREEMILGGAEFTAELKANAPEWRSLFRHDDELGAVTLVKRIWHWSWLDDHWGLHASPREFPMPNTHTLARHLPQGNDAEDPMDDTPEGSDGKYFAVLALDGDSIGQWISGDKAPCLKTQLAAYKDGSGTQSHGSLEYFQRDSDPDHRGSLGTRFRTLLESRRLVSPSYHLQFSEALGNFALRCARRIVEAHDGRLIYAGGDDVLAMLPADTALACARALRSAFQGNQVLDPTGRSLFQTAAPGFLTSPGWKDNKTKHDIPFLVPGPNADCSAGIAIAHFKDPLQDVIRAAQAAEKRAKKDLGRSAVAVNLMKRSGEIIEWGCKWNNTPDTHGGIEAFEAILASIREEKVSAKFPHRLAELAGAYLTDPDQHIGGIRPAPSWPENVAAVLDREIDHVLARQKTSIACKADVDALRKALTDYLNEIPDAPAKVASLVGLCQTAAFISRNLPKPSTP